MSATGSPFSHPIPSPDSTLTEVEAWLTAHFQDLHRDPEKVAAEVNKCNMNGELLYAASEKRLKELWPDSGHVIYHKIQSTVYGRFQNFWTILPVAIPTINFACGSLGLITWLKGYYWFPLLSFSTTTVATLGLWALSNYCCTPDYVGNPNNRNFFKYRLHGIPDQWFWHTIKIPQAAAA